MSQTYDFDRYGNLIALDMRGRVRDYITPHRSKKVYDREEQVKPSQVTQDKSRDALLTDFGKQTLMDRYLMPGEQYQIFLPVWPLPMQMTKNTPNEFMIISLNYGSCQQHLFYQMADLTEAFPYLAF